MARAMGFQPIDAGSSPVARSNSLDSRVELPYNVSSAVFTRRHAPGRAYSQIALSALIHRRLSLFPPS